MRLKPRQPFIGWIAEYCVKIFCRYEWTKDGRPLGSVSNILFVGNGTLHMSDATRTNEGVYQCFAENIYGRTMSTFAELQMAMADSFSPDAKQTTAIEGQSFEIGCRRTTKSFPTPAYSWELKTEQSSSPIYMDERRQMDQHGNYWWCFIAVLFLDFSICDLCLHCFDTVGWAPGRESSL